MSDFSAGQRQQARRWRGVALVARHGTLVWWALVLTASCAAAPARSSLVEPSPSLERDADAVQALSALADAQLQPIDTAMDTDAAPVMSARVADEALYVPGGRHRPPEAMAHSDDVDISRWNAGGSTAGPARAAERTKAAHPAPRVKVDVISVRGRIDESEVLKQVRAKGYWPFRQCYEAGLRRAQKLRGTARVRVTVDARGRLRKPKRVASDLADDQVVACLLEAASAMVLAVPQSRGTPEITFEVALFPGDEPLGARDATSAAPAGDLPAVTRILRETWPRLRQCYAQGLARDPTLWGRLAVRLVVATRGRVREATEVESHFADPAVTACVCQTLGQLDGLAAPDGTRLVYALLLGAPPSPANDGGT